MDTKKTIRKFLFLAMWLVIGGGMLTLFIAAMSKQKRETCKGYSITIKGQREADFFLDKEGIVRLLKAAVKGNIKGQSKALFDLQELEQLLENNVWINDAQLYFDNQAVLHISVTEREPIARIFTVAGKSLYMDSSSKLLPLSEKALTRVPVFTGFPDKKKYNKEDSVMLRAISATAQYINSDPFWSSQVAQIDIVSDCGAGCWQFEMVPLVGRHIIKLGDGEDVPGKFKRLFVFYQQVLNKTGFDHYKSIDVRFAGQVVGAKSDTPKIDSVRYRKYVEEWMKQSRQMAEEDVETQTTTGQPVQNSNNRTIVNSNSSPKPYETPMNVNDDRPKAVMPRRD